LIFCFDIDGTISEKPGVYREIMKSLVQSGHIVYPLTAMQDSVARDHYESMRLEQLMRMGLDRGVHFTDVVVCVAPTLEGCGDLKGKFCKNKGVVFMVEDTAMYAESIERISPETLCLRMPNGLQ